ncbi:MAG: amino acid ABC transporter substrate-binding protein [Desulfobacteraceae bacterium]|nr:MAG: amino acid ABC transporter substrate-binding protein [Desulfobacteraceae bacterium]
MKRSFILVAVSFLSVALFGDSSFGKEPYAIGFNVSFTITHAVAYQMQGGSELAIEDINSTGGINGTPLKLLVDDNKLLPTEAVLIAKKTLPKIQAMIVGCSGSTFLATMPLAAAAKVPVFGPGIGTPEITERGNRYVFRTHFNDKMGADAYVNFIVKKRGLKKVAIVNEDRDYGLGGAKGAHEALTKLGITPVAEETYSPGMVDFTPIVLRLKKADPDAIILWGFPAETSILTKQLRGAGIMVPVGGCNAFENDRFRDLAQEASNNAFFVSPYFPEPNDAEVQRFIKRFEERFKKRPDAYAVNSYDTVQIIADGLRKAGRNKDAFQAALRAANLRGLNGTTTFDENGDNSRPIHIIGWQDGKRVKVAMWNTSTKEFLSY